MKEFQPKIETKKEEPSQIILHFMRHSMKAAGYEDDYKVPLSEDGRNFALQESQRYDSTVPIERKRAYGSPRLRSRETAQIVMNKSQEDFDQIIRADKSLDYKTNLQTGTELAKAIGDSFKDKTYLKTLVEQSDQLAEKTGDNENSTYSDFARNIASFIDRHVKLADRWHQRTREYHGEDFDPRAERFVGTHQGTVECFVAKVLEIQSGNSERDKFVEMLSGNGFDFIEGVDVVIETDEKGTIIKLISNSKNHEFELNEIVDQKTIHKILTI